MEIDEVSPLNKCQTVEAKKLVLFDVGQKLAMSNQYNIGGTYTGEDPDLCFFYHTTLSPGNQYLLSLFVCHRKPGIISVGVGNSNILMQKKNVDGISSFQLPMSLTWKILSAEENDENNFIKTFCFKKFDVSKMNNSILVIPIEIDLMPKQLLQDDVINRMKVKYHIGDFLLKNNQTDFEITTPSQKKHKIHKIVLAAHSPVLRNMLKDLKDDSMFIDITDNDLELLIKFLYTGTIDNLFKQNYHQLLEIAEKFQLNSLFQLTEYAIIKSITVDNAINAAIITEKYKLSEKQIHIFDFIKNHPNVFRSEGWRKLNNVNVTKKLLEYISQHP